MESPTYGYVDTKRMMMIMNNYYAKNKGFGSDFDLTIGTDSQNFSDTKVVIVVALRCVGHGGIYFYEITHINKINDVRTKLNYETEQSLSLANDLMKEIETDKRYEDFFLNTNFAIHVDAGHSEKGKTRELIPGIVGWIKSYGYECVVKPESYAASSLANKISK